MTGRSRRSVDLQVGGPRLRVEFGVDEERQAFLENWGHPVPAPVSLLALVDTGASNSGVVPGTFARLGVLPTGTRVVETAGGQRIRSPEYLGRMWLPGGVIIPVTIDEFHLSLGAVECLLGRDILAHGRLLYDGAAGSCTLILKGVAVPLMEPG